MVKLWYNYWLVIIQWPECAVHVHVPTVTSWARHWLSSFNLSLLSLLPIRKTRGYLELPFQVDIDRSFRERERETTERERRFDDGKNIVSSGVLPILFIYSMGGHTEGKNYKAILCHKFLCLIDSYCSVKSLSIYWDRLKRDERTERWMDKSFIFPRRVQLVLFLDSNLSLSFSLCYSHSLTIQYNSSEQRQTKETHWINICKKFLNEKKIGANCHPVRNVSSS